MNKKTYHASVRVVHKNTVGYIGKCSCSEEVLFCIGTVISFMPKDAFLRLNSSFQQLSDELEDKFLDLPNGKKITIRTPIDNLLLSFSREEYLQVLELFGRMELNIRLSENLQKVEYLN